jgi:hypothetical protein
MTEIKSLDQAADCIEATNLGTTNAFKGAFAIRLRNGSVDVLALEAIERDARRQLQACRVIREHLRNIARGDDEAVTTCPTCGVTVFRSSDNLTGHCTAHAPKD